MQSMSVFLTVTGTNKVHGTMLKKKVKEQTQTSGYAMWFTAGGAIREPQNS